MRKSETFILSFILLLALAGLAFSFFKPVLKATPIHLEPALAIPASVLLANRRDFLGGETAPYALIEFGDYECPPCRGSRPRVKELLAEFKDLLKLDFRNLPLPQIHSSAMFSALVAEAAREKGRFWNVHNSLYETALNDQSIEKILKDNLHVRSLSNSQMQSARQAVKADMAMSERLKLEATPSFVLATPDGKLFSLNSLESIPLFIK